MAKVISYSNQKGGVGKSTLCIQQAFYLAEQNYKVLVIDFDGQGNTSSRLAPRTEEDENSSSVPVFSGTKTANLFTAGLESISVTKCSRGIDLIYTPKNDPELFEKEAIPLSDARNPANNLRDLFFEYDYVLVDCPPSLGRMLVAALMLSTHVVCPVKLSGFAVDGVEGLLQTIIGIQQTYNPNLEILGMVINDMDRSVNHDNALKSLERATPGFIFKNRIMHRPPLDLATTEGVPVWSLRHGHVAAKEVRAVLDEIIDKVNS